MTAAQPLTERQSALLDLQPLDNPARIVLLQDAGQCYRVEEGEVSMYVARMRDGAPLFNRTSVCTFAAGEFIFPGAVLHPDSLPPPVTDEEREHELAQRLYLSFFMAVGEKDKLSVVDRQVLLQHADLADQAVFGVENWVRKISEALPKNTDLPEFPTVRLSGEEPQHAIDHHCFVQSGGDEEILWLRFAPPTEGGGGSGGDGGGDGDGDGDEPPSPILAIYRGVAVGDGGAIDHLSMPLIGRDLITVQAHTHISVATTQAFFSRAAEIPAAEILDGFDYLAKTLLYVQALQTEQQQQRGIDRAKKIEEQNLSTMFDNFQSAFHGKEDISPHTMVIDRTSVNSNLLLELCKVTRSEVKAIDPELIEAANHTTLQGLERLLTLGGFDKRKVVLEPKWYTRDAWMMVGFLEGEPVPVLLYYEGRRYRYYNPQTREWGELSEPVAKKIETEALVIYRPLNENVTGLKGFLVQALQLAHVDIKRIVVIVGIVGAINVVHPVIMGKLLSEALPSFDFVLLNSYLLALFAATLGVFVADFFSSIAMLRIETYLSLDMHASIWGRLLRLPMTFFKGHNVGNLASRANIFDDLQAVWTSSTANALSSSISMVFSLGLLFYYSWRLAFIIMAVFALFFVLVWVLSRRILPIVAALHEYKIKIDGLVFQLLQGIAKLRVASKENTALALWSNLYNKTTVQNRKYMFTNNILQVVASVLPLGGSIIIFSFIYFGLLEAGLQSGFDLGDFIAFNAAFGQVTGAMLSLAMVFLSVVSTVPMARLMEPILQQPVEVSAQKAQLPSVRGDVRFDSVQFQYQPDIPVLKNISLDIREGEYVAIVGRSGSGKSTLFNLLLGFEEPQTGAVFVDDANIQDIDLSELRQRIGVVLQNGDLLPGSIYENISCENSNITMDVAWEAAEKAGMKKDIEDLPMGMHTLLSAFGGGGLSGGQLQRVMIARAIARNPRILLLDEATSALDNTTQRIVQDSLLHMNITRIVIAHRLTTISNADRIYVIDKGQIAEHGSYEELLEKRGLFYELAIRQMQAE